MSLLEWRPDYSVGNAAIDAEHREMIELINDIYAQLESDPDAGLIEQGLGDIFTAISMHFALEERFMLNAAYDEYDAHKADHEELLDQLRDLMDEYVADPKLGAVLLEQGLSDWFSVHFATFDARLHGALDD